MPGDLIEIAQYTPTRGIKIILRMGVYVKCRPGWFNMTLKQNGLETIERIDYLLITLVDEIGIRDISWHYTSGMDKLHLLSGKGEKV